METWIENLNNLVIALKQVPLFSQSTLICARSVRFNALLFSGRAQASLFTVPFMARARCEAEQTEHNRADIASELLGFFSPIHSRRLREKA